MNPRPGPSSKQLTIPIAIVIAAALIAGAIFVTNRTPNGPSVAGTQTATANLSIRPISANDHVLGNPDAPIKIFEYADFRCPYCRMHQETLHRIVSEYGPTGQVAWIYRHAPLVQIQGHEDATLLAVGSECAAQLGGNAAFWKYADALFAAMPDPNSDNPKPFDNSRLPDIAAAAGVDVAAFQNCVAKGTGTDRIKDDLAEAINSAPDGQIGTPYNIIEYQGQFIPLPGAYPYANMKNVIETILAQGSTAQDGSQIVPAP